MSKEIIPSPGGSNKFSRLISKIKAALGIVENGSTASHTIASGKFVTWKGDLYKAKSAIPSGTTLSSSNLQAVSEGGLNELSEQIGNLIKVITLSEENISVPSGVFRVDIPATNIPSGYSVIGVLGWNFGGRNHVSVTGVQFYSNEVHIFGLNNTDSAFSVNPSATIICMKQ